MTQRGGDPTVDRGVIYRIRTDGTGFDAYGSMSLSIQNGYGGAAGLIQINEYFLALTHVGHLRVKASDPGLQSLGFPVGNSSGTPMLAHDGKIYGFTFSGSSNAKGTIYRADFTDTNYTVFFNFDALVREVHQEAVSSRVQTRDYSE